MVARAAGAKDRAVAQWAWGLAGTDEHFEYSVSISKVDFQMVPTILVILINMLIFNIISSVSQFNHSVMFDSETPWTAARQASLLSITSSWSILKLISIESVMPSNHLILCCPLLLLPSIFSSNRVFSKESFLHIRWSKYWSFCFNIGPSNEYSGLISFRMDWSDLLAVQGTLKNLLQHHSSKASILWLSL